ARLGPRDAGALLAAPSLPASHPARDKPVTPPDSYRVVMENERMRMIEIHIKPHSKVNVDSPANRERFLYMLSDGALILSPPGKKPYEFALHAGETAVFPAVSPTVENDTDAAVRALMVEMKGEAVRSAGAGLGKTRDRGSKQVRGKSHTKVASSKTRPKSRHAEAPRKSKSAKSAPSSKSARSGKTGASGKTAASGRSAASSKSATGSRKAAAEGGANAPLNLSKANARPGKKVTGKKGKGNDS